ncbi:F-box only protein 22-like [Athalia rosae]|uniref:F-box only protein 22-like n=1 Tax=Athalia rosae TaxID=37344 RepID=UPI000626801F|nr:F-box only protein 22-like [Athalia rosae]
MEKASKKKTRNTKRSSEEKMTKSNETEVETEGPNFGEHITYDVLRMIFEYSTIRDLSRAALVCRSWNEAAKKEKQTRIWPRHFLCNFEPGEANHHSSRSIHDDLFIDPCIGLVFFGRHLKSPIHNLEFWVSDCLYDHLSRRINSITIWNYGLMYDGIEKSGNVVCGLFLPEIPGVKIRLFSMDMTDIKNFRTDTTQKIRDKSARELCGISPDEDNIKCIMFFLNQNEDDIVANMLNIKHILKSFHRTKAEAPNSPAKIALWGGMSLNMRAYVGATGDKNCTETAAVAGISICGSGVSTWSIVLNYRIRTKAQVEKELTTFRDAVKLQKHSVGFMFACCGRDEKWFKERHVESTIFRKLFPNIPLVGSFGGGEIGTSTIPHECSKGILHEYATAFLIITYGSVRNTK